jgi:hypothetical protein
MPVQYGRVRSSRLKNDPEYLIKDKIGEVLENYYFAVFPPDRRQSDRISEVCVWQKTMM